MSLKFNKIISLVTVLITLAVSSFANDMKEIDTQHQDLVVGTISAEEVENHYNLLLKSHPELKIPGYDDLNHLKDFPHGIKVLKLAPNPNYIPINQETPHIDVSNLLSAKKLDLYGPPLNQGSFGTCVTFAMIGAYNTTTHTTGNNGRSPSCVLQLLKTQGINAWDGYDIWKLYWRINDNGWPAEWQGQSGMCNQTYLSYQPYGSNDQKNATLISLDTYRSNANFPAKHHKQFPNNQTPINITNALHYIKQEINNGWYPAFAFYYLHAPNSSITLSDGAYAAWSVRSNLIDRSSGHALFAYGYDDNIVVNGQKGVLYLRNSWGYQSDTTNGNYLMTYDFFVKYFRPDDFIVSFER